MAYQVPDLFMRRVMEGGDWTLFCPNEALDEKTGKTQWEKPPGFKEKGEGRQHSLSVE